MRANITDEFQCKSPDDNRVSLTLISTGLDRCVSGVIFGGAAGLNTHTSHMSTHAVLAGGAELITASERSAEQSFIRASSDEENRKPASANLPRLINQCDEQPLQCGQTHTHTHIHQTSLKPTSEKRAFNEKDWKAFKEEGKSFETKEEVFGEAEPKSNTAFVPEPQKQR